ncbi:COMM domain-containing protein 6 isoform X1 [Octodon degus]|uniref:COMM domain-containing protein 6 n=1 Tax=Octodon degus TaxID=10160 RepID=A0A6P6DZF1_OCTDE|nr:COMM domain-containing protein 6 isoform X1 [Octodon degus]
MEGSASEKPALDAKSEVTNQLIDFQWKLGMAVSSDSCRSLKYPYVAVMLKVADHSGQVKNKSFEMTIPQFQVGLTKLPKISSVCFLPPSASQCWSYRCVPTHLTSDVILERNFLICLKRFTQANYPSFTVIIFANSTSLFLIATFNS